MRVLIGISIRMMHAMHYAIGSWAHIRRTLSEIGQNKKDSLPKPAHGKSTVRSIAVLKESLGKQRQIPMGSKKEDNKDQNIKYRVTK